MNIIRILLYKEFIILKKSLLLYVSFLFLFPLILFLFFSIPLSLLFMDMKPIYTIWSSIGICFVCSLFLTYLFHFSYLSRIYKKETTKSLPIWPHHYLFSGYIFSIIVGLVEFFIAILVTSSMTSDIITIVSLLKLIVIILPSIIIVCNLSFLIFKISDNFMTKNIFNILIFLILSLGFGSFIPLSYFPENYNNIVQYLPIASSIYNAQNIIVSKSFFFSLLFISFFYMVVFSFISYFVIDNNFTNKN